MVKTLIDILAGANNFVEFLFTSVIFTCKSYLFSYFCSPTLGKTTIFVYLSNDYKDIWQLYRSNNNYSKIMRDFFYTKYFLELFAPESIFHLSFISKQKWIHPFSFTSPFLELIFIKTGSYLQGRSLNENVVVMSSIKQRGGKHWFGRHTRSSFLFAFLCCEPVCEIWLLYWDSGQRWFK